MSIELLSIKRVYKILCLLGIKTIMDSCDTRYIRASIYAFYELAKDQGRHGLLCSTDRENRKLCTGSLCYDNGVHR